MILVDEFTIMFIIDEKICW